MAQSAQNQHPFPRAALRETPIAIVWAMHAAVLASLMPLLEEDAKPFFYPALRLSDNESAAELHTTHFAMCWEALPLVIVMGSVLCDCWS